MNDYNLYQQIKDAHNFTNLVDTDTNDNLDYPKQKDANGYYTVNFDFPVTAAIQHATCHC